ncbi:hypothetical protein BD413DRAFT_551514 [Trametes elegans]|nr:hypothetical protein BD413DRAFT_551514 [Trametes elegans]
MGGLGDCPLKRTTVSSSFPFDDFSFFVLPPPRWLPTAIATPDPSFNHCISPVIDSESPLAIQARRPGRLRGRSPRSPPTILGIPISSTTSGSGDCPFSILLHASVVPLPGPITRTGMPVYRWARPCGHFIRRFRLLDARDGSTLYPRTRLRWQTCHRVARLYCSAVHDSLNSIDLLFEYLVFAVFRSSVRIIAGGVY